MLDHCTECESLLRPQAESLVGTLVVPHHPDVPGVVVRIEFSFNGRDSEVELRLVNTLANAECAYQLLHLFSHLNGSSLYSLEVHIKDPYFIINPAIINQLSVATKQPFLLYAKPDAIIGGHINEDLEKMMTLLQGMQHICRVNYFPIYLRDGEDVQNATIFLSGGGARRLKGCVFLHSLRCKPYADGDDRYPNMIRLIDNIVEVP